MAKEYGTVLGTSLGKIPEELWDMPRSIFTMSLIKKLRVLEYGNTN